MLSLDLIAAILVLLALALIGGAVVRWRQGAGRHAVLMVVAALVAILNLAILLWPVAPRA